MLFASHKLFQGSPGLILTFNCEFYAPVTKLGRNTPTQKLGVKMSRGYRINNSRNKQFRVQHIKTYFYLSFICV